MSTYTPNPTINALLKPSVTGSFIEFPTTQPGNSGLFFVSVQGTVYVSSTAVPSIATGAFFTTGNFPEPQFFAPGTILWGAVATGTTGSISFINAIPNPVTP